MNTRELTPATLVDFIAEIFARRGSESYLGEAVTMSQHMLQAAHLAEQEGADEDLVAAALLHDIGHYTNEFPDDALAQGVDNHHDKAGAAVLAPFFPPVVVDAVRGHVAAKRYLCTTDTSYHARLSPASVHTLKLQGGFMSQEEIDAFRRRPNFDAIIRIRQWDEAAKDPDASTPPFEHYTPLLQRVVERHLGGPAGD